MVDYQTISIVFTGLSISLAAFYYISTLRNTQRNQQLQLETRQAQLFMQIYNHWYNTDFWKNWDNVMDFEFKDYDEYYEKITPEISYSSRSLFAFFEGLGVLVKRELITPSFIDDLMSALVINFWEKMRPVYTEYRVRRNAPMVAEWIEYLYNTIKPIMEDQHPEMKGRKPGLRFGGTTGLDRKHN